MIANPPDDQAEVAAPDTGSFRLLKADELVSQGDFVTDGRNGFMLWEGPSGFRADSFVKPIYRKRSHHPTGAKKLP